jgi:hypothetical protein
MAETVFRSAQSNDVPQSEPVVDKTPGTSEKGDTSTKLVATYQEATGNPYTAQFYDITNVWNQEKGFQNEVATIEGYVKDLVTDDQLDNSTEAADKWYKLAEKKAGVTPEDTTSLKLIKLSAWVKMQREIKAAMEWKYGKS